MTDRSDTPSSASGKPWIRIALAATLAAVVVLFFVLGGPKYFTLDAVKAHRDALLRFTELHYGAALAIAFLVYVTAVSFSLPVGLLMSLTIGFLFGRWVGTAVVVLAATVGATIVFLAARYLFADMARRRMGELGRRINAGFTANAFHYMLFLRLLPLFPFFLVNLAPALTDIPVRTFTLATLVGIVPLTFVFVNFGHSLGRLDSLSGLLSPETLAAFTLLGLATLTPILWKKFGSGNRGNT